MSDPPPILDYQPPTHEPKRRDTSVVGRFALGSGLALLAILGFTTLYGGSDDAPGLVCCDAAFWLGGSAGIFALANFLRAKTFGAELLERNRLRTVIVGVMCMSANAGFDAIVPGNPPSLLFAGWIIVTVAASWAAMRASPRASE